MQTAILKSVISSVGFTFMRMDRFELNDAKWMYLKLEQTFYKKVAHFFLQQFQVYCTSLFGRLRHWLIHNSFSLVTALTWLTCEHKISFLLISSRIGILLRVWNAGSKLAFLIIQNLFSTSNQFSEFQTK